MAHRVTQRVYWSVISKPGNPTELLVHFPVRPSGLGLLVFVIASNAIWCERLRNPPSPSVCWIQCSLRS